VLQALSHAKKTPASVATCWARLLARISVKFLEDAFAQTSPGSFPDFGLPLNGEGRRTANSFVDILP